MENDTMRLPLGIKHCEEALIALVRDRLGVVIHKHQKNDLEKIILQACTKFNCLPEDYLQMLEKCSNGSPLLEHLIAGVTIGETYFFRDKNQMQLLQETLLPNLIKLKRESENLSLRIWSAGCASGEEIYTVAMMLCELLPDIDTWTLDLLGTDINANALKKSIAASYGEWAMRLITPYYKLRYFREEKQKYILADKVRDLVRFDYLNLNESTYPSILNGTNAQDLIICRNVLIYFDHDSTSRLMKKLTSSLVPGGYLLLGASDPIVTTDTGLVFHHEQGVLFSRPFNDLVISPPAPIKKTTRLKTLVKHIITKPISLKTHSKSIAPLGRESESVAELNAKATECANLGKLDHAVEYAEKSLALEPTNIEAYFTLAMALSELHRFAEAESALRKTIFLDHHFVMGHFQLGLLQLRNKQLTSGIKSLRNALAIADTQDKSKEVIGFPGLNYEKLTTILQKEIDLHLSEGSANS